FVSNSMNHDEEPTLAGYPNNYEAALTKAVIRVGDRYRKRIAKDGARLAKSDAVLASVIRFLFRIPLENEPLHVKLPLFQQILIDQPLFKAVGPGRDGKRLRSTQAEAVFACRVDVHFGRNALLLQIEIKIYGCHHV